MKKNGKKSNNKGGDTIDYLYNEDGQIISSTSVQEYYSQVPSGNSMRGYGYKWKPISPALKDPSFDMFVGYVGGGVVGRGLGVVGKYTGKYIYLLNQRNLSLKIQSI
ncbi:hypothetical protein [Bergeyella zoohelcum]|uniref:hypothetical protein n=1 Tax=Bergeyella zoohelcum TaxID=1015 RepID=UPI002A90BD71|nr:hypothetical protein [Bergeyella zoohelcum]MDY6024915.1 hypothetical protein [Bergeyella zoohelcum]